MEAKILLRCACGQFVFSLKKEPLCDECKKKKLEEWLKHTPMIEVLGTYINADPLHWNFCPYCKRKLTKDIQPQFYGISCRRCGIYYISIAEHKLRTPEEIKAALLF